MVPYKREFVHVICLDALQNYVDAYEMRAVN